MPTRIHKHRYCGVLAPNAKLRRAVIVSAGPAGATAKCWVLLLTRIYECLPLLCPRCGESMRIIAFVLDPPTIERILRHIAEPTEAPPQCEFPFNQDGSRDDWPDMDLRMCARRLTMDFRLC